MKKIIKPIIFLVILIAMIFALGKTLRLKWELENDQYKYRYEIMKNEFGSDIKSVFLGSSGTYTAINQMEIFKESDIPTVNLSHSLQSPLNTYYLFEDYIEKNDQVKLVFLDVLGLTREVEPNKEEYEPYFYRTLVSIDNKKEYLSKLKEEYDKDFRFNYYMPFFHYHDRWNRLTKSDFNEYDKVEKTVPAQTVRRVPVEYKDYYMKENKDYKKSEVGEKYLKKIIDLAKSKDMKVVLFVLPKMDYYKNEIEEYHKFAKEHNLEIVDFTDQELFEKVEIDIKTDFYDPAHLNYHGGKKISKFFAEYILENYPELKTEISKNTEDFYLNEIKELKEKYSY